MDKSFRYKGNLEDLKQKMTIFSQSKNTGRIIFNKNKSDYTIYAKTSWGTLGFIGGFGSSINVHVKIERRISEEHIVRVYTYLRPENYFFGFAFILSFIAILISGHSFLHSTISIGSIALTTIWFNFIYKIQEENLLEKVVKHLKLRNIISPIQ